MKEFLAAVKFFTILPLPERWGGGEKELGRSVPFLPVIGLLIGILVAALDYGLTFLLPQLLASVFAVIALLAVSGGFHLDGLADTADGFLSSRSREGILEIMKDSRTGPMGVAAVVSVIGLKVAALASIPPPLRLRSLLLMPLAGRCALIIMMALLPYARPEGGLGSIFHRKPWPHFLWATAALGSLGWWIAGWTGVTAAAVSLAAALLFSAYSFRKIGGMTGDTLGAVCEIAEAIPAVVAASLSYRGIA